ncbi:hypothetical protein [Acinetobacter sp. c3-l95]|uniref:hypothetical protein n=1 Tax=Acinetobacter sp. c3-l95 TaxID=3342804 RepID=UPI0035B947B1
MAFLSKLIDKKNFSQSYTDALSVDFTEPPLGFKIVDVRLDVPLGTAIEFGQVVTAKITYQSDIAVQIWVKPELSGYDISGAYEPSEVEPAGLHTITRFFHIDNIVAKQNVNLNQIIVLAKNEQSVTVAHGLVDVDYILAKSSDRNYNQTRNDGVGTAKLTYSRISMHGTRLARHDVVPMNVGIDVYMHFECQDQYGAKFAVTIDELECGYTPQGYDHATPKAGQEVYSSCSANETGEIKHLTFVAYNHQNAVLTGMKIDFPLTVVDMSSDGLNEEDNKNAIFIMTDKDTKQLEIFTESNQRLHAHNKISVGSKIQFKIAHECMAEYGGRIQIFDTVGEGDERKLNQILHDSVWLKKDYFNENQHSSIITNELDKSRQITGFVVYLYNMSGEILAYEVIDFPLHITHSIKELSRVC